MPTLAARSTAAATAASNSPAAAMTTISNSLDANIHTSNTATTTMPSALEPATCTFATTNSDYQQHRHHHQQQQQQQQQQLQLNNHHYHHPPPPHPVALHAQQYDVASATTITTASAVGAVVATATSFATFNGNSNLNAANGNIGSSSGSNGNDGNNSSNSSSSVLTAANVAGSNKSETSSIAGSVNGGASISGAVAGGVVGISSLAAIKKTTSSSTLQQLHTSREDVASLGGASSINSQMSATNSSTNKMNTNNNNNNNNGNTNSNVGGNGGINSNNNSNSILKGSKENLLQAQYNGLGNDDPGDGLGPLPPKWETAYTERGELYFIDHNTGTSHWLDPRLSKFQKKSLEDCGDNELPYGWEKIEDSLYGTYYIDHVNRRTQYENPVLEAKRRAAEQKEKQYQPPLPPMHSVVGLGGLSGRGGGVTAPSTGAGGLPGERVGLHNIPMAGLPTTVDISQRGMQPPPPGHPPKPPLLPYKFTRNPTEMQGERISTMLLKSARGLGITIVGGDDGAEEFLQIKSIVPNGPAWLDGQLQTGDILVYVNDTCVLGFTHHEMVNVFQSILPGETVTLEVCRGYPLPFDPNDPNTEVVTTIAVDGITTSEPEKQRRMLMDLNMDGNYNFLDVSGNSSAGGAVGGKQLGGHLLDGTADSSATTNGGFILMKKPELHTFSIIKGAMGFGFTIADSAQGQKVKKILDRNCCTQLQEGDVLLEINNMDVRQQSHLEVVQLLKDCSKTEPTTMKIQRGGTSASACTVSPNPYSGASGASGANGNVAKLRKNFIGNAAGLFRSKTPTADLYSTQQKEILPIRPKTPLVDTRRTRVKTPNNELTDVIDAAEAVKANGVEAQLSQLERTLAESKSHVDAKSTNSLQELDALNHDIPFMDPYPKLVSSLSERLAEATLLSDSMAGSGALGGGAVGGGNLAYAAHHAHPPLRPNYENQEYVSAGVGGGYSSIYGLSTMPPKMSPLNPVHHSHHAGALPHTHSVTVGPPLSLLTPTSGGAVGGGGYLHHHEACYCYDCQDYRQGITNNNNNNNKYRQQQLQPPIHYYGHPLGAAPSASAILTPLSHHHSQYSPASLHSATGGAHPLQAAAHIQNERMQKRVNELLSDRRKVGFSPLEQHSHHTLGVATVAASYLPSSSAQQQPQQPQQQHSPSVSSFSQQQQQHWGTSVAGYNTLQPIIMGARNGYDTGAVDDVADHHHHHQQYELSEVTLERQALGFGFRIVGGTEEGSQVTVGHVVPGGAADLDHRINTGDEILSIDGISVVNSSHHKVVSLMGEAALRGQVTMILRRRTRVSFNLPPNSQEIHHTLHTHHNHQLPATLRPALRYPYDVIVSRHENEGFGFVIISSSNQYYGSTIGKLIPGSPADRCGELKVGDRIIAVNRIDIAGMSHGDVVNLIKESGLHVRLTIGCPKEGAATVGGNGVGGLLNSAQASPGQLSQAPLLQGTPPLVHHPQLQQQALQQHTLNDMPTYFERPTTSVLIAAQQPQPQQKQQHQQQPQQSPHQQTHQQLQQLPPQL